MNLLAVIDWKFILAGGAAIGFVVLTMKMTPEAAERVLIHAIDAY